MFKKCCLGLFFLSAPLFLGVKAEGAVAPTPIASEGPKIRVLLEKNVPSALLEVKGKYRVIGREVGTILSSGGSGKRFVVHAINEGLRWGEEYPDIFQITIQPVSNNTTVYVNGIQYRGAVTVFHVKNNKLAIVNEVPIEDYLKSTLATKLDALSDEALAALVIVARTEAYSKILAAKEKNALWDVASSEANYLGYWITQQGNGVESAVDRTRFLVLNPGAGGGGLSQTSAEECAQKGFDAKKILSMHFPKAKLSVLENRSRS